MPLNTPPSFVTVMKTLTTLLIVSGCTSVEEMVAQVRDSVAAIDLNDATGCKDVRRSTILELKGKGFTENGDKLTLHASGNHLHVAVSNPVLSAISNGPNDGAIWVHATDANERTAFDARLSCVLP